jgi:hypothetical protein
MLARVTSCAVVGLEGALVQVESRHFVWTTWVNHRWPAGCCREGVQ